MIRTRLRRLIEGIDPHVGRRVQYRSDAAVGSTFAIGSCRTSPAGRRLGGYTAGLTEAQIQAKIAADPAFVGAEQGANEAIHDLLHGRSEPRESNMAAAPVVDRERAPTAERTSAP